VKNTLSLLLSAAAKQGLPCLLIGGNAVIALGFPRLTIDIDLLVPLRQRSQWLDLMRELGYRLVHGTDAFAQFASIAAGRMPVDLMWVDDPTWASMSAEAAGDRVADQSVRIPRVEHLIALKLHAASSPTRLTREKDWEDIRQMVLVWNLNPADEYFREIILRYGGEEAMSRILRYRHET
jgi:hypothetical protein